MSPREPREVSRGSMGGSAQGLVEHYIYFILKKTLSFIIDCDSIHCDRTVEAFSYGFVLSTAKRKLQFEVSCLPSDVRMFRSI